MAWFPTIFVSNYDTVLLQPDRICGTVCHLTCDILLHWLQRLQTPTENISLWIDCSAAHCDFSFECAIEIFLLTYLLTYFIVLAVTCLLLLLRRASEERRTSPTWTNSSTWSSKYSGWWVDVLWTVVVNICLISFRDIPGFDFQNLAGAGFISWNPAKASARVGYGSQGRMR